ncbi:MAG: hypothetical protein NUW22_10630 [Acidobacteria bacterium]|nr:hypothetical protein [Acidobacteriota bacterium]
MIRLVVLVAAVAVSALGGWSGWLYTAGYVFAVLPGCLLGARLFGRGHPAAWVSGALAGSGLAAVGLWLLRPLGWSGLALWLGCGAVSLVVALRVRRPLVPLPCWRASSSTALASVLLVTMILVAVPLARVGEVDAQGNQRYRAYFTADFVWHQALTAELARTEGAPRNPYFATRPLAYYWGYFVLPATVARQVQAVTGEPAPIDRYLKVNALWTALLFMSAAFLAAWVITPQGWAAAVAVLLTLTAASAEGLYAAARTWQLAESLEPLRELNVDAVTHWWLGGLTIDSLIRGLWYNPQHSAACALGLTALVVAMRAHRVHAPAATGVLAGLLLGAALVMSPFPGGAMTIVFAGTVAWQLLAGAMPWRSAVVLGAAAVAPVVAAWGWLVTQGMTAGAAHAISYGLSTSAVHNVAPVLMLAIGPILLLVGGGAWMAARRGCITRLAGGIVGVATALLLYFFVTLDLEPIWVGWRSGQVLQATAPIVIASALVHLRRGLGRWAVGAVVAAWAVVGLPTTVIDAYNAQDTTNESFGPGFHWTVVVTPGEQEAFAWIQHETEPDAVFQMALGPRGRETWSLIPSFARRRLAAGLPISLLMTDRERDAAIRVDDVFSQDEPGRAWAIARAFGIQYLFVGRVEREAFPDAPNVLAAGPDFFHPVFSNADATVYAVTCRMPAPCR